MIVRYLDPLERLKYEVIQRRQEGHGTHDLEDAVNRILALSPDEARQSASDLLAKSELDVARSPLEPDDLDSIKLATAENSPLSQPHRKFSEAELYDRILGGWLGRAAGCLLGKPVERYPRTVLREMLESSNDWPLDNYWTEQDMPKELLRRYPWKQRGGSESLRENIECMPEDDDLNYVMLNLYVMESFGFEFSSADIGTAWLTKMPALQAFTAERLAYLNLLNGLDPPETATFMNPYREWIGAQIRADLWGYVSPGNPQQASELAWRDARVSHTRNGIYGEMFFATLIANAFVESNLYTLVESALNFVPSNSRFARAIDLVLNLDVASMEWEAVVDKLYEQFDDYHWVHTINNAALTVAALLASNGDYEKTICNTVMGGWDTDSNGATAGSVIGVIQGAESLPRKWIAPLNDRIRSCLGGFDNARFSDLAHRTHVVAQRRPEEMRSDTHSVRSDDF